MGHIYKVGEGAFRAVYKKEQLESSPYTWGVPRSSISSIVNCGIIPIYMGSTFNSYESMAT